MDFAPIAKFNNKLEAETVAHILDQAGITYLIQSDEAIFGDGGIGPYVSLQVPADRLVEATELLAGTSDEIGDPSD
jgi:hypothetical protein